MPEPLPDPLPEILSEENAPFTDATLRTYRAAWRDLLSWKETEGPEGRLDRLPGQRVRHCLRPEVVEAYLRSRHDLAWSTLTSRRQAIRYVARNMENVEYSDPFSVHNVQVAWREVRRKKQKEEREAPKRRPETLDHSPTDIIERGPELLEAHLPERAGEDMAKDLKYLRRETARPGDLGPDQKKLIPPPEMDTRVLRDRALLLLVGTASVSRTAVLRFDAEDVRAPGTYPENPGYAGIGERLPAAEGKPTGIVGYDKQGALSFLLRVATGPELFYCPNRALAAWILAAGLTEGPIFRSFTAHGALREERMRPQAVNYIIKERARAAGELDPGEWNVRRLRG